MEWTLHDSFGKKEGQVPIIFLTNRKDYVFEGYEVQALRYILKPLEQSKWNLILDELFGSSQKEKKYLLEQELMGNLIKLTWSKSYIWKPRDTIRFAMKRIKSTEFAKACHLFKRS